MSQHSYTAFTLTDNGSTGEFHNHDTGHLTIFADGSLGGGSLQVEASVNGGTWFPTGSPVSATGVIHADQPAGDLRVTLSGAIAPNVLITFVRN